jgi:DNA-binding CsgD family transcriptional regulator/PAS domain-containing protein
VSLREFLGEDVTGKDALLDTVAAIYDSALEPQAWPAALARIGELLSARLGRTWTVLAAMRPTGELEFLTQERSGNAEHMALFREKYTRPNTNPSIPSLIRSRQGGIVLREQDLTDEEWHRNGMYREVFRPAGIYHGLGAVVSRSESHMVVLGVTRPKRAGQFSACELNVLSELLPHVRRAMHVFLKLADLESHKAAHLTIWDGLPFGIALLDGTGKVLWTNQEATAIFARADGLTVQKKRLCAANAAESAELQWLIATAVATRFGAAMQARGALSVSRPSLARSFALLVAPIHMERIFLQQPAAVVFITDPERNFEAPVDMLTRLYGLTRREAALAALLLQGNDLKDAAGQLGTSMSTARTHLRLIFEKTDTHRQSELIHLMLQGPAGLVSKSKA